MTLLQELHRMSFAECMFLAFVAQAGFITFGWLVTGCIRTYLNRKKQP